MSRDTTLGRDVWAHWTGGKTLTWFGQLMKCRHCSNTLGGTCLDLGTAPPSNAFLDASQLRLPEAYFPLKLRFCENCSLLQTEDFNRSSDLFTDDYVYFSSVSSSWLAHARRYVHEMTQRLALNPHSRVVEIASNDGYLLQYFVAAGIPCLGIEPTASTADAAEKRGIPVLREFFGEAVAEQVARSGGEADLIIGNNVFAHVPDINDFARGIRSLLKPQGTVTLEFPHLLNLIRYNQFDTVYHEHYSYLSLNAVQSIFAMAGLRVYDVEHLPTHGGSLRVFGCHAASSLEQTANIAAILAAEREAGLFAGEVYSRLQDAAQRSKLAFLSFLVAQKSAGKRVAAYGAAAKGNTLLNYCGVKGDLLPVVFDAAPSKQGKFLPGSRIPVLPPSQLSEHRPDFLVLLPWNLYDEVRAELLGSVDWPMQLVRVIPEFTIDEPMGRG